MTYCVRLKLSAGCLQHFTKNKTPRKSDQNIIRRRRVEGDKSIRVVRGWVIQNELRSSTLYTFNYFNIFLSEDARLITVSML